MCTCSVEAALKLIALGPRHYFSIGWNRLDFIVLVASVVSEQLLESHFNVSILRVFRVFSVITWLEGMQVCVCVRGWVCVCGWVCMHACVRARAWRAWRACVCVLCV